MRLLASVFGQHSGRRAQRQRAQRQQTQTRRKRVAVIGEGAVGTSSALALIERDPTLEITVFHDVPFEDTVSWGPAGLFRVDTLKNRFVQFCKKRTVLYSVRKLYALKVERFILIVIQFVITASSRSLQVLLIRWSFMTVSAMMNHMFGISWESSGAVGGLVGHHALASARLSGEL